MSDTEAAHGPISKHSISDTSPWSDTDIVITPPPPCSHPWVYHYHNLSGNSNENYHLLGKALYLPGEVYYIDYRFQQKNMFIEENFVFTQETWDLQRKTLFYEGTHTVFSVKCGF